MKLMGELEELGYDSTHHVQQWWCADGTKFYVMDEVVFSIMHIQLESVNTIFDYTRMIGEWELIKSHPKIHWVPTIDRKYLPQHEFDIPPYEEFLQFRYSRK